MQSVWIKRLLGSVSLLTLKMSSLKISSSGKRTSLAINSFAAFSYFFSVVALFFAVTLVCDPAHAEQGSDEPTVVRIATVSYQNGNKAATIGVAAVVERQKWLENALAKRGIKLEWVYVSAQSVGATVNEAFANNSIDFAAYGDLPSIILNAGGVQTRVIVPGGVGSNVYLVVPPNSQAQSIKDLVGKRIALHRGRPWELAFARLVAANGLKLSDFKISNLNPGAGAAALAAGSVDAFVTLSDAYQLVDRNVGRIIWSTKKPTENWRMRAELWGAKNFIDKYPAIVQLVATAYVNATYWVSQEKNFQEYLAISAISGQPENVLRREYENESVSWKARWNPLLNDEITTHYQHGAIYSKEAGLIRNDLNVASLFDDRFVTAAIKELKLQSYWSAKKPTQVSSAAH